MVTIDDFISRIEEGVVETIGCIGGVHAMIAFAANDEIRIEHVDMADKVGTARMVMSLRSRCPLVALISEVWLMDRPPASDRAGEPEGEEAVLVLYYHGMSFVARCARVLRIGDSPSLLPWGRFGGSVESIFVRSPPEWN